MTKAAIGSESAKAPVFPVDLNRTGLTKRELFAVIFAHAHISGNIANGQVPTAKSMCRGALHAADALIAELAKGET